MKPSKNWNYCPDCCRNKMLFESESKVKTFIKFNGEEVANQIHCSAEDLRPYYCQACAGWHFSHKPNRNCKTRTDIVLNTIKSDGYNISEIHNLYCELVKINPTKNKTITNKYIKEHCADINPKTIARAITMFYKNTA